MKHVIGTVLAGCSLLAISSPAWAAEAEPTAEAEGQASQNGESAPEAQADAEFAGNVIIVQARRRDEAVQDVPLVVNTVGAETFEKLNLQNFTEVQQLVPGLTLENNANGFGGNAQLRGVNFNVNVSGFNNTVEFYQNDAPILPQIVLQQTYDIAQVEVLRGPQGTLRGRASPSGSLTVTTRKADLYEVGGYVDMSGSDIGTLNVNGAIGLPIIEGKLGIRVAGLIHSDEVNRVRTVNGATDGRDPRSETQSGRVSIYAEPADWLRLEGSYQRLDRSTRFFDQVESFSAVSDALGQSPVPIAAGDRLGIADEPRINDEVYDIYNAQAGLSLGGQSLIYVYSRTDQTISGFEPQDFGNFFPTYDFGQLTEGETTAQSHELRLQNEERLFGFLDYVIGGFYRDTNSVNNVFPQRLILLPAAFGGRVAAGNQQFVTSLSTTEETSVFGNLTFHIGDNTELSGGLRYIDFSSLNSVSLNRVDLLNPATLEVLGPAAVFNPPLVLGTPLVQDTNKVIYQIAAKHNFSDDFMVYASTGTSFRPAAFAVGDFSVRQSALQQSFQRVGEETSTSYEIGFKSTSFDNRLRFNLTGFYQEFENFTYRAPGIGVYYINFGPNSAGTGLVPEVANFNFVAGVPVEVLGVEAEIGFQVSDNFNIGVVAAYANGEIKGGVIPCNDFVTPDGVPDSPVRAPTLAQLQAAVGANNLSACTVDQPASNQPDFVATATADWNMPISDQTDIFLRGLLNFNGATEGDPTNDFDSVDEYAVLNLFTGVRSSDGAWEVTLFAKNVFEAEPALDRTLPLSTPYDQLQLLGFGPSGPILGDPIAASFTSTYSRIRTPLPREFGINVRYAFGSR